MVRIHVSQLMNKVKNYEFLISLGTLVVTIVGLAFVVIQISDARESTIQSLQAANNNTVLQIMYSLNQQLISSPNSDILYAVNNELPIRTKNGGNFSDIKLENYLSIFEALGVLYAGNEIHPFGDSGSQNPFLCDSFFDSITDSLNNKEIQNFLTEKRKDFPAYQSYLTSLKKAADDYEMCPEFN